MNCGLPSEIKYPSSLLRQLPLQKPTNVPCIRQSDALQSSLLASSKWSEDWELILNPSKSEHLPIGDTSNPVAYSLTSSTSSNAQPVQTVSSVRDLGLLLNTDFSADDNVARATKKARGMLFYLTRSFAALTPSIFLPLYKAFIHPHLEYAIQASSPILSREVAGRPHSSMDRQMLRRLLGAGPCRLGGPCR